MKHHLNVLITAYILSTATSCNAMEVTTITKPKSIAFITNTTVVVGGENGCGIFDSASQQLIHKLTPSDVYNLAAHKDIVAVLGENKTKRKPRTKLTIFNTETGKKEWSEEYYYAQERHNGFYRGHTIALSSIDTTLFLYTGAAITTYNYIKQQTEYTAEAFPLSHRSSSGPIACDPTKNILLYSDGQNLYTVQPPSTERRKNYDLFPAQQIMIHNSSCSNAISGLYSSDGNKIVFSYDKDYCIYDVTTECTYSINECANDSNIDEQRYIAAAFHPSCPLLALLSKSNVVQFWNYVSRKHIATTYPLTENSCKEKNRDAFAQRLAFSPNGTQLAVALIDHWTVINTPALNKNFAAILYLLRNKGLPQELINIIMLHITHSPQWSYCDLAAILKITPLPRPQPTTIMETNTSPRTPTEYKRAEFHHEDNNAFSNHT